MNRCPRDGRYLKPERAQDASTAHAKEEIATAISMLERAALEQNHSNAAMQLANLYLDGISPALRPDPVRAERMLNLAADLGSDRAAKWRASAKGQQLQKALKNSTPLSKGYVGMLLLALALVFLLRIRMAYAKLEKRGGKKGVVKKLKVGKDKDH
jgi:TPR repeat protein